MRALVLPALACLLLAGLSGCTLLKDEEPFELLILSEMQDSRTGSIVVTDGDGDSVFRKPVTLTKNSIHTAYHLPALDGTHTIAWESGGQSWSDTRTLHEGDSATIILRSPTEVCFDFRQTTGNSRACDTSGD